MEPLDFGSAETQNVEDLGYEEPGYSNVLSTLAEGLKDCDTVDSRTPNWALRELRDIHNSCHGGSESSAADLVCYVPDVEQASTHKL